MRAFSAWIALVAACGTPPIGSGNTDAMDTPRPHLEKARSDDADQFDASSTHGAISRDGAVLIVGRPQQISHTHGGPPARIGLATFLITNHRDVAVPISVTRVEWLDNTNPGRDVAAAGFEPDVLPPGASTEVTVSFEVQDAYQSWNDRYASRVTFRVETETLVATVEHLVMRRNPLQPHIPAP